MTKIEDIKSGLLLCNKYETYIKILDKVNEDEYFYLSVDKYHASLLRANVEYFMYFSVCSKEQFDRKLQDCLKLKQRQIKNLKIEEEIIKLGLKE